MTRKSKRIMTRILAVVLAATLVPSNMWGTASVVRAEEATETFTKEDSDVSADDAQEPQEEASKKETSEPSVIADDGERADSVPVDAEETTEDDKKSEVKEDKKETEKDSAETDNKATVEHVHNFSTDGNTDNSGYFTINGNPSTNLVNITYNNLELTKAIKLEGSNPIVTFDAECEGTLTVVVAKDTGERDKRVKINGTQYSDNSGVVVVDIPKGNTTIAKGDAANLYYISFEGTGSPKVTVEDPTATPTAGTEVKVGDTITLSCTTEDATIYYTTDGSEPKNNDSKKTYSTGISVTVDMVIDNKITIKAYASKTDCTDSDTVQFTYDVSTIPGENQLKAPTAEPDAGEVPKGTEVKLKSEDGASIYYTTDETNPSTSDSRKLFTETNPIVINQDTVIKAVAIKAGKDNSFTASFTYTIKQSTIDVDEDSKEIISSVEKDGDVIFVNQEEIEVFDVKLKAQVNASPTDEIKEKAESLTTDGTIIYYDLSLINAEAKSDTVTIAEDSTGQLNIKMCYPTGANKRNEIIVLHDTDEVVVNRETDGFGFSAKNVGSYTVVIKPASQTKEDISITKSGGYEEGAYAEWETIEGVDEYMAYVAPAGGEFTTRIDDELLRKYDDHWRVDVVGLAKGTYYIKINAVVLGKENDQTTATVIGTGMTKALNVTGHDRSGYAWVNGSSSGAYNEDGTLKSNANVIYVTEETKDKVELEVTGAESNPCVGLQNILNGYKKLGETKPLNVRIIGNITDLEVLDEGDIVISGSGAVKRLSSGITIEGIGEDAVANGWGIRVKNASNVEIRNLGFMNCDSKEIDNVGLQQDNDHVWVHHCDMFYGGAGGDSDQAKGDGALDVKKSTYVTFSYNHFWDSGKCNLAGLNQETTDMRLTYHHNWYDHSDSRHPRIRYFTTHIYNNYYDGNAKYGVGAAKGGPSVFVENNYFRNCPYPMLISMQGSDVWDGSKNNYGNNATFSKEDGGIIKAYGNIMEGVERFIPYLATDDSATAWDESVDFDAYVVENRNDIVPSTVKTVTKEQVPKLGGAGGNTYSNFDTAPDFYDYTPDAAEDVPAIVMAGAGRVNGGDFKWEFDDSVDDKSYALNVALKTALVNYKSPVKAIGGNVEADVKVLQNDTNKAPEDVVSKAVDAPTASIPTGTEVAKGDKIALECTTSGAEIYYTINGSKPTKNSTLYTGEITITSTGTTIIRAIAILGNDESDVSIFKYTVPGSGNEGDQGLVDPPTATPNGGNIKQGETVTLEADGTIYYTLVTNETDSNVPISDENKYITPIPITAEVGTTVIIKAIAVVDGKSSAPRTFTYTVVKDDAPAGTGLRVVLKNKNEVYIYTGSAIKPDIVVWNNSDKLVEGVDYTVAYKNNINASTDAAPNKKPQITVTGKGNLTGKATTTFEIKQRSLSEVVVAGVEKGTPDNKLLVVDNTKPAPVLYYGGTKLSNKDYTVPTDKCTTADNDKEIEITGKGNFTGSLPYKIKVITKDQLKKFKVMFTDPGYIYNGTSQTITLADDAVTDSSKTDTDGRSLEVGTDYTIVYQNDTTNAGKVKFTVVGLGYYTGSVAKTYTIKPLVAEETAFAFTGVPTSCQYIDTGVTIPTAGITYTDADNVPHILEQGKDYKLAYGNNKKVGTAKITATFMGNYKGNKITPKTFEITKATLTNDTEGLQIVIPDAVYNNKPGVYKSVPYVSVNGVEVKSSEYIVKYYTSGTKAANGTITINPDTDTEMGSKNKIDLDNPEVRSSAEVYVEITGKGKNYDAETTKLTASYNVRRMPQSANEGTNALDLSKAKLTVYKDWKVDASAVADKANKGAKMEYTGVAVKPGVMIEFKDAAKTKLSPKEVDTLIKQGKLTVSYVNNVNKGKATIVINGDGENYVGGKTVTFSITTKNLKDTDVLVNLFNDISRIIQGDQ